ncbi:hypothetical protein Tco_0161081, partial [Tanacetum coccineum]
MLIPDVFLTEEIRATDDFKEYETVFMNSSWKEEEANCWRIKFTQKSLKITIRQQKVVKGEKDDDDFTDRLEPGSHKDNPKPIDDDDDKYEEKVDEEEGGEMGSLETRTEEMQTPTTTTSNTPHSKRRISSKYSHLPEDLIEKNLNPCIAATIIEDRDAFRSEVPDLVSQEFNAQAPKI